MIQINFSSRVNRLSSGRQTLQCETHLNVEVPESQGTPGPYSERFPTRIRTLRLLPENETRELSLFEKSKNLFKTSSLPEYSCDVEIEVPCQIRLDDPLALHVRIHPGPDDSSLLRPTITLDSFRIEIEACTHVRAAGLLFTPESQSRDMMYRAQGNIAAGAVGTFGKENDSTVTVHSKPLRNGSPSFSTLNISHKHFIKVQILLKCAGEEIKRTSKRPVIVLPREPQSRQNPHPRIPDHSLPGPSNIGSSQEQNSAKIPPSYQEAVASNPESGPSPGKT